jgi:hypothetical protein
MAGHGDRRSPPLEGNTVNGGGRAQSLGLGRLPPPPGGFARDAPGSDATPRASSVSRTGCHRERAPSRVQDPTTARQVAGRRPRAWGSCAADPRHSLQILGGRAAGHGRPPRLPSGHQTCSPTLNGEHMRRGGREMRGGRRC